jgi:hypothetical protein
MQISGGTLWGIDPIGQHSRVIVFRGENGGGLPGELAGDIGGGNEKESRGSNLNSAELRQVVYSVQLS